MHSELLPFDTVELVDSSSRSGYTVMLVDDCIGSMASLSCLLSDNFDVLVASSLSEALLQLGRDIDFFLIRDDMRLGEGYIVLDNISCHYKHADTPAMYFSTLRQMSNLGRATYAKRDDDTDVKDLVDMVNQLAKSGRLIKRVFANQADDDNISLAPFM